MKAIYINLDPYLQAFADWLAAGKPGDKPKFSPLPLAITVPLGQDVVLLVQGNSNDAADTEVSVDGETILLANNANPSTDTYVGARGLSAYSGFTYWMRPVSGDSVSLSVYIWSDDDQSDFTTIPFTVIVRRETASGPVDLVDFTPPAAALTAAAINTALGGTGAAEGQPLKGVSLTNATNAPAPTAAQINAALGGTGSSTLNPLGGVSLEGMKMRDNEENWFVPVLINDISDVSGFFGKIV